jgi:hypothetical protein
VSASEDVETNAIESSSGCAARATGRMQTTNLQQLEGPLDVQQLLLVGDAMVFHRRLRAQKWDVGVLFSGGGGGAAAGAAPAGDGGGGGSGSGVGAVAAVGNDLQRPEEHVALDPHLDHFLFRVLSHQLRDGVVCAGRSALAEHRDHVHGARDALSQFPIRTGRATEDQRFDEGCDEQRP